MKAIELVAEVDERHSLQIALPASVLPGPVRVIVLTPEPGEEESDTAWMQGIAHEGNEELQDPCQDIYTLEDGKPVHAAR